MGIAALTTFVGEHVRSRGEEYFSEGRVRIRQLDGDAVLAVVRGTIDYDVALRTEAGGILLASCDCPYFETEYSICKHIWATILEMDRRGILDRAGVSPTALFEDEEASVWRGRTDDEADDEIEGQLDDEVGTAFFNVPPRSGDAWSPPPTGRRPPRPPQWKQRIATVRENQPPPRPAPATLHPQAEISYILRPGDPRTVHTFIFEVVSRRPAAAGGWTRRRPLVLPMHELLKLQPVEERELMMLLAQRHLTTWVEQRVDLSHLTLPFEMSEMLLPRLCATGRFFVGQGDDLKGPLRWNDGPPWQLRAAVASDETDNRYVISGRLVRGDERMSLEEPAMLIPQGFVVTETEVSRLEHNGAFGWAQMLRSGEVTVPRVDALDLVSELMALPARPSLDLPEELRWEETTGAPKPCLRLMPEERSGQFVGHLLFDYDGIEVPFDPEPPRTVRLGERKLLLRDPAAESVARRRLEDLGFLLDTWRGPEFTIRPKRLIPAVAQLTGEGWRVEGEGKLYRNAGAFRAEVTSGIDWFELHGSADFEGQEVSLPRLLKALRKGQKMIQLGDGSIGLLPAEWIRRYTSVAALGKEEGDHLRFGRAQVGLLDALLAAREEVSFDKTFERARKKLASFEGVRPKEAVATFRGELRPYQKDALGWFDFLEEMGFGGCLADDMGLGKTVQVLALLEARRHRGSSPRPSLVVVPKSLVFNWKSEAERFTPNLAVLDFTGPARGTGTNHFADYDLIVTTYGTLRRQAAILAEYRFGYVILDEAQAIKNTSTQAAKAARLLLADHRLALSGTPIENHLGELWSLFEFLNPGLLGSSSAFRSTGIGGRNPDEDSRHQLARALRPFILRRTKEQVATDLPAKIEQTIHCDLEPKQRHLYDELREYYRTSLLKTIDRDGLAKSKIHVLEALLRLRQAACHPRLVAKKTSAPSAKLDALIPQIEEILEEDHKILVFSQFTSFLAIVREELDRKKIRYCYLDGASNDREQQVERFQTDPDFGLFLISLKAGGLGLNLTAAEYVYILDPWWNPAVEAQAVDRAHRIGQSRQVFAYRLVCRDTVEEKILELQKSKRDLADAIINADNSLIKKLTAEDVELLLS